METTPKKKQEINLCTTNPKEEKHTNVILPLITKVTGTHNPWSLIYLNINGQEEKLPLGAYGQKCTDP